MEGRPQNNCYPTLTSALKPFFTGGVVDVIYFDFAKAFDSVLLKRLLGKLSAYGIDGKILK